MRHNFTQIKFYKLFFLIGFLFLQNQLLSQEINTQFVKSDIESITVFLNNAEIQRQSTVEIPTGKSTLVFENISSKILDKGIKVSASNEVKVYTVSIEKDMTAYVQNETYQSLKDSLNQILEEQLSSKYKLENYEKEMFFLEANMKVHNSADISFSKIDEAQEYFLNKVTAVQGKMMKEKRIYESLSTAIDLLSKKEKALKNRLLRTNARLKITLLSNQATSCKIDLRYLVSNAIWKPLYSIRATEGSENIEIQYQAQIFNNTGLDWNDKPITLAMLDPSQDIEKPALTVWTLERNNYEYSSKKRSGNYNYRNANANVNVSVDSEFDVLEIDDLSTRFELQELHRIPSDSIPHLIDIVNYKKQVEYYNLSIPKMKNGAYLIARINDWENLGLIDGRVNLYYNNTYQGYSNLETQQINDSFDICLGIENTFTISRKKISSKSKKNLIGFNIVENFTYEIIIRNNKNEKSEILIKDQIPVSVSKDVEIKLLNSSGGTVDPLTGELKWDMRLKPEEMKRIVLEFSIKYPKSKRNEIRYNRTKLVTPRYF